MADTQLAPFVGKWKADGRSAASPHDPAAPAATPSDPLPVPMHGVHTYEWLPGEHFLVHRWDMRVGNVDFDGMWVIGHDATRGTHRVHLFDDRGNATVYDASVRDGMWTFTGKDERATLAFSADGNAMEHRWEMRDADGTWRPLCQLTVTRA